VADSHPREPPARACAFALQRCRKHARAGTRANVPISRQIVNPMIFPLLSIQFLSIFADMIPGRNPGGGKERIAIQRAGDERDKIFRRQRSPTPPPSEMTLRISQGLRTPSLLFLLFVKFRFGEIALRAQIVRRVAPRTCTARSQAGTTWRDSSPFARTPRTARAVPDVPSRARERKKKGEREKEEKRSGGRSAVARILFCCPC